MQPEKVAPKALIFFWRFLTLYACAGLAQLDKVPHYYHLGVIPLLSPLYDHYVAMTYFLFLWALVTDEGDSFIGAPDILCP